MSALELTREARAELDLRLAENGWRWRSERDAQSWTTRILLRMASALLDPDAGEAAGAAREAFVDGLIDARRAGAIVPGRATIGAHARPSLSLVGAPRRAVRLRAGAVRRPPSRLR